LNTGAIYDPASDTWTPMSTIGAPIGRQSHSALWTGSRMLIWGGLAQVAAGSDTTYQITDGGLYDPATDIWQPLSVPAQLQVPTLDATAVSTGSSLLIWGGFAGDTYAQHGARFDLTDNSWAALAVGYQPSQRIYQSGVWTGVELLVWGGVAAPVELASGARYFP
jgi:N-acetylneuraminic acid mutarotase